MRLPAPLLILLAAVLWPEGTPYPTDADRKTYKTLFSQWGLDPIWATGELAAIPATWTFPLAAATGQSLTLQESPLLVDAAGHAVQYDPDRKLWFSDIVFEGGISAPVRTPRGRDIDAACGQLKTAAEKKSRAERDRETVVAVPA